MVVFLTIKRSLGDSMVSIEEYERMRELALYWMNLYEELKKELE